MTIAVTAVSGQLGAAIAEALITMKAGETIVGLARSPEKVKGLGIEIRPGDYDDDNQLRASLAGVDTVLLVSGMAAPEERIGQHRNVINAAKAAGVTKIVYTSVQGAEEGTAFSPVIQSNRQTEADVRDSGLDWVIGRNGIYIEPDVEYIDSYRKADRIAELVEFMGTIIAGIYQGIHDGALDNPSDFDTAAGRPHQRWDDYFASLSC